MKKTSRNILIILVLFISIAGAILPRKLNDLDEIWNYNFARCISNELLPYRDFNMIQTPLLPIICGTILKLTFDELIIMRILAVILMTSCLFVTYKIFERLKINKYIINIFIIGIYLLFYKYFCIDYNYAVLLIILISIYIELKYEILEFNFNRDFLLGILVGSSILFKQTTGLALTVIFVFYKLLLVSNKPEFKTVFKIILNRILGVILPILVFTIYLIINNIWNDFIDYTILSISTFSNKISYKNLSNGNYGILIQALSIILPIAILIMYYVSVFKKHKVKEQKNIFILFCYSVASAVVVYPISDSIHFLIGTLPSIISICYLFYILSNKIIEKSSKVNQTKSEIEYFMRAFSFLSIIAIVILSFIKLIPYIKTANKYIELKHFKYIPATSENIKEIDKYILEQNKKGNKIYILDATAAIYMITLDKYNKDYDMFLKGNLGAKGEKGIIEKLRSKDSNSIILILNDNYKRNWQTPETVIDYVTNNWIKKDEIGIFDIYEEKS